MSVFFGLNPLSVPEDWKPLVGADNWVRGHSAYELAHSWQLAAGAFPPAVERVLSGDPNLRGLRLRRAIVEFATALDTGKAPSMTDLMAQCLLGEEPVIMAVEGKAKERFDLTVDEWLARATKPETRHRRLQFLCELLGLDPKNVGSLRYQLLHRTASAVLEAAVTGAAQAVVLVHSYSHESSDNRRDWSLFLTALGIDGGLERAVAGSRTLGISSARCSRDIPTTFVWVEDEPRPL